MSNNSKINKFLFFIILGIIAMILLTSCDNNSEPHGTYVHSKILPYVEEFQEDCIKYGWDPNHVYKLNKITFGNEYLMEINHVNGLCIHKKKLILIHPKFKYCDNRGLRHVVYHELGHWYGKDHSERGIMYQGYSSCNEYSEDVWKAMVKFMMIGAEGY